ncbi:glycosyltransferase [Botrimarina sp.]|uniref:glycosyltransferase family 2 protein n=1 Tax=Botrimarina sp. TaxID=2795802 RepID=UPI0032ED038E
MLATFVIPTYRRPDVLRQCLEHLCELQPGEGPFEVRVLDNGAPETSGHVIAEFAERLNVYYVENEPGHGMGYSLGRGAEAALGELIVELNDDALVPPDFLARVGGLFARRPEVGVVGFRAIEEGYASDDGSIGAIDADALTVRGNFDRETDGPVEVEHVYGFCYAYRRQLLERGGRHDKVLLAKDYSSGNRIETDHCLTARRLGYRVIYDGTIAVVHLAKPRTDLSERSERWRLNHLRNTLYLFLKHFGPFGRRAMALRYGLTHDVGLISLLKRPTPANARYFWVGLRARGSAVGHWLLHLTVRQ